MLILDQNIPMRLRAPQSTPHALAAALDDHLARRAPKRIGAGINRIGQNVVHGIVYWQLPDDAASFAIM